MRRAGSGPPLSRVVVLGAGGFVGGALVEEFRRRPSLEVRGTSSKELDLTREGSLSGLDGWVGPASAVLFPAGITRDKGDTLELLEANVSMAVEVARYLCKHPPACCVYFSSTGVYDDIPDPLPVAESARVSPRSSYYCLSKWMGERILERAASQAGFRLLILRLCRVYGPGDTHVLYGPSEFLQCAMQEKPIRIWGDGKDGKDFLYISDMTRIAGELVLSGQEGVFNLATGRVNSFLEVAECVRRRVPGSAEIRHVDRTRPPVREAFDISKLTLALPGLRFTTLEEGIGATYKSLL